MQAFFAQVVPYKNFAFKVSTGKTEPLRKLKRFRINRIKTNIIKTNEKTKERQV